MTNNFLISTFICMHDHSLTFIKNNKLKYLKLERFSQKKHHGLAQPFNDDNFFKCLNFVCKKINFSNLSFDINSYHSYKNCHFLYPKAPETIRVSKNSLGKHHYLHAMSVEFMEKKPCDVYVVIDGQGDANWCSIYRNHKLIAYFNIFETGGSIGHGLAHAGKRCGVNAECPLDLAGKAMGLQSYGKFVHEYYEQLLKYNMNYIGEPNCSDLRNFINENHMFKISKTISQEEKIDWLHVIHKRAGEIILSIFEKYVQSHEKVGYSGGVAQNVVWNTMLKKKYPNLTIYPHSSDEGISIGHLELFRRQYNISKDILFFDKYPYCQYDQAPNEEPSLDTIYKTAKYLAEGKIVAWYQGHGEIGPRALGNRSILMDPRIKNGKDIINNVKKREWYRPFGCSVLEEYAKEYFDLDYPNPYMLYLGYTQKEGLDAITHIDGTSRSQTVNSSCGVFRTLLEQFHELTGCPVLLNTSLNEAGKPIAGWIKNAENLFKSSSIDVLVVGNSIYEK